MHGRSRQERRGGNFDRRRGRLSDYGMQGKPVGHWAMVRDAQVKVATDHPRGAWVDTDDLNDKGNPVRHDLHYTRDGYVELGKRFAEKAIALINKK